MDNKELLIQLLEEMHYHPKLDEEGDVIIRYQMKLIVFILRKEDDSYINMSLYSFRSVHEEDKLLAMTICNVLNRKLKLVKLYLEENLKSVSASCDFHFTDKQSMAVNVSKALDILGNITCFYNQMKLEYITEGAGENGNDGAAGQ